MCRNVQQISKTESVSLLIFGWRPGIYRDWSYVNVIILFLLFFQLSWIIARIHSFWIYYSLYYVSSDIDILFVLFVDVTSIYLVHYLWKKNRRKMLVEAELKWKYLCITHQNQFYQLSYFFLFFSVLSS